MIRPPLDCDAVDDVAAGFVLGALDAEDAHAVRDHLATCERGHPELAELGGVVPYLALAAEPIEPADALRARILTAVAPPPERAPAAVPERPAPRRTWRWAVAGLVAVLVIGLAGVTAQLAVRLGDAQAFANQASAAANLAAAPGSRTIALAPTAAGGPAGTAVVGADGRSIVLLDHLSPTSGSQVYEVWAILGSGTPTPAGSLHLASDGRGWLETPPTPLAGPLTVAVTREPGPGATTPTLPILTAGAASG